MTAAATPSPELLALLAKELELPANAIKAVVELLDGGGTVPFIARYRKEATGGLDEVQIRKIEERRTYLKELGERPSPSQSTMRPTVLVRLCITG